MWIQRDGHQGVAVIVLWEVVLWLVLSIRRWSLELPPHWEPREVVYLPSNYLKAQAPVGSHYSQNHDSSSAWKLGKENTRALTQFSSARSPWSPVHRAVQTPLARPSRLRGWRGAPGRGASVFACSQASHPHSMPLFETVFNCRSPN